MAVYINATNGLTTGIIFQVYSKALSPFNHKFSLLAMNNSISFDRHDCRLNNCIACKARSTRNSYTMGCPPVRGDNPRALASGLSYVQVDKHGITILYHLHQCRPCTSRGISC